jgi:hypothetical protein
MEKFHLSFDFRGRFYQAVILMQEKLGGREFAITELNEELARLLSGNNMIREIDGTLEADVRAEKKDQTELKLIIASKLGEYLKMPCFVGDECLMPNPHVENWQELHPILRRDPYQDGSVY